MQWHDTQAKGAGDAVRPPEAAPPPRGDAERVVQIGQILLQRAKYGEAAAAFERAETLGPADFRQFVNLAFCYLCLGRADTALRVCERGNTVMPDNSDLHRLRGDALDRLNRKADAREAYRRAIALSPYAFTAAENLLLPLCDALPPDYANCTLVRGFRAIGLSRVGRTDEASKLVDLDKHVAQFRFKPPDEFGGIERFNAQLAQEILRNPTLQFNKAYGFYRTENLDIEGARFFPVLAKFLQSAIEQFIAEFPSRGLDAVLPPVPRRGFLRSAGNVVREEQRHHAHAHKFAYISGVYHVCAPRNAAGAHNRAGALVVGSVEDFAGGYVPCWGSRDIKPEPGVATLFPSHIFHSVVPTRSKELRIAVPFDLGLIAERPP
jgi:Putative 2OG-Fe(II) oxygenase/Tetratricopeptide repeat